MRRRSGRIQAGLGEGTALGASAGDLDIIRERMNAAGDSALAIKTGAGFRAGGGTWMRRRLFERVGAVCHS